MAACRQFTAAVLADDEGDGDDRDDAGHRLQIFHDLPSPIPRASSVAAARPAVMRG
jgi:hypothetical protein